MLDIPDLLASKKEKLEERLKVIKLELDNDGRGVGYKKSIREGEAREIIEKLREL